MKNAALLIALASLLPPQSALAQSSGYAYVTQWGTFGAGNGQLNEPQNLVVGRNGHVFVADTRNHRIEVFSRDGIYLNQWGGAGAGNGQFQYPHGVAIDAAGNVYVADTNNQRIQKFTSDGEYVMQWGSLGTGNGQFEYPWGVAVGGTGNVYVGDANNFRIQEFTSDGRYVRQWGSAGSGNSQFEYPNGVAVDGAANVYVADNSNSRVQKFTGEGAYLTQWGSSGGGDGQFGPLYGIAVDGIGNVYVADTFNDRIQRFTGDGTYLTQWGTAGSGNGQLNTPFGLAVDDSGNVYVADSDNHRIQKFAIVSFAPVLTAVRDVPHDQGGRVFVTWLASRLDDPSGRAITGYRVWRRIPFVTAAEAATAGIPLGVAPGGAAVRAVRRANAEGSVEVTYWEALATLPAEFLSGYGYTAPTTQDSMRHSNPYTAFFVTALTADPYVFYESNVDSGYSVDNLKPRRPTQFIAVAEGGGIRLHWDANSEGDLAGYRLHRGGDPSFAPTQDNLVTSQPDTGYFDPHGAAGTYYKVAAVDVHENSSDYALTTPSGGADVNQVARDDFALRAVRPNPSMGDRLEVEFALARSGPASLELLDVAGRRVVGREVGQLGAGPHSVDLAAGRRLVEGVYIVRLSQDGRASTTKAAVIR